MSATELLAQLSTVGRDPRRGGYSRPVFSEPESALREWFSDAARRRGLDVEIDRNGAMWAWWDIPGGTRADAVVTGSHLDSVPGGGAFDGPLGVASALAAVDGLQRRGHRPRRPIAVVVFPEEEGSRFGLPCLGSGLMTGTVDVRRALGLRDDDGNTVADVARANGLAPEHMGRDPETLGRVGAFVELHVEQGRGLVDLGEPVATASSILAHGRWRVRLAGQGNHAGTTAMGDRQDPMVAAARLVVAVQETARRTPGARATVGKITPTPGGANVIASSVDVWLDVRHPDDPTVRDLVRAIGARADSIASSEGCTSRITEESLSPQVRFDTGLRDILAHVLPAAPVLATGAGHDAGVLAPFVPTAMLFVRNPSGVSHSPDEHVESQDVQAGADALTSVLAELTAQVRPGDPA